MARQLIPLGAVALLPYEIPEILAMIAKADPGALIVGGCLRDVMFEKRVKDIDVFVGPHMDIDQVRAAFPADWSCSNQFSRLSVEAYRQHFGADMVEVIHVVRPRKQSFDLSELVCMDDYDPFIQIIVMNKPVDLEEMLYSVDFGFCQIGIDARCRDVMATPAFVKDATENTATLTDSRRDAGNIQRSLKRAERLREKYPTRKFVLPGIVCVAD